VGWRPTDLLRGGGKRGERQHGGDDDRKRKQAEPGHHKFFPQFRGVGPIPTNANLRSKPYVANALTASFDAKSE